MPISMSDSVWWRFYMRAIHLIPNIANTVCLPGRCVPTNWCRFISCLFRPRRRELPGYYSTSAYARRAARCIINLKLHCAREREFVCCSERPRGSHTHVHYMGETVTRRYPVKRYGRIVSGPDVQYCSTGDFKAVRATSSLLRCRIASLTPSLGLLWLMHFARDPICMHRARKSGTKLNCRYIVPQERTSQVIPTSRCESLVDGDTLNSLRVSNLLFILTRSIRAAHQTFPRFAICVRNEKAFDAQLKHAILFFFASENLKNWKQFFRIVAGVIKAAFASYSWNKYLKEKNFVKINTESFMEFFFLIVDCFVDQNELFADTYSRDINLKIIQNCIKYLCWNIGT